MAELIAIRVRRDGRLWRTMSDDGLFTGLFLDRAAAIRSAREEVDIHPGHRLVIQRNR